MLDILERAKLIFEPEDSVRVQVAEGLQRDPRIAIAIERLVHDPHPARAEPAKHLKSPRAAEVDFDSVQGRRSSGWAAESEGSEGTSHHRVSAPAGVTTACSGVRRCACDLR